MDMPSRNQYLYDLRKEYLKTKSKEERGKLLNEAEKRTRLNRKYLIRKLRPKSNLDKRKEDKKKRKQHYDGPVKAALVEVWKIFDYPCGQRLKTSLEDEADRLRGFGELQCSDETASKLKTISSATIDRKLIHEREVLRLLRKKGKAKSSSLLLKKIPVKMHGELDKNTLGNIEVDFVEHCGSSAAGQFCCTIDTVDIALGWQEWEVVMGRGQIRAKQGLDRARKRYPFSWLEMHPDNDKGFINDLVYRYAQGSNLGFSRSRAYKKNDNCHVEQRNWFSVRRAFGYLRFDTEKERRLLNDLYRNELRLYRNFFLPTMKLKEKIRVGSKVHRKYEKAQTPYRRIFALKQVPASKEKQLKKVYDALNPAQLKRDIDLKLDHLYSVYQQKKGSENIQPLKKQRSRLVTNYMIQQDAVRLPV